MTDHSGSRAEALRRAFDSAFAAPPATATAGHEDLLCVGVGDDRYAVRLGEVTGLFVDRVITPVPGPFAELVGVAGLRDAIVPVYDLSSLLGYPVPPGTPRWLLSARLEAEIGFLAQEFQGYLRVLPSAFSAVPSDRAREHVREVVRDGDELVPVLSLASLTEAVTERTRHLARPHAAGAP